jgi:transposase
MLVFQDEAAVRLLPSVTRTYAPIDAPIGQTPQLECDVKNKAYVSISGVISSTGYFYFEVREQEGFKQKGLTRFLDNLWADCLGKLTILWDNASSHKSKTIKEYLANQSQENPRIWLANTPPYSPELNPIELLWGVAKKRLANHFVKTTRELKKIVTSTLNEIKEDKELIISFFKHEELECYHFFN